MNAVSRLRELGYGPSSEELARFQRDCNRVLGGRLLVNGKLDAATEDAAKLAHASRVLFEGLRDKKGW